MAEPGRNGDLPAEPFDSQRPDQLGVEELDRDLAVMPFVLGEVDRSHAPPAQEPVNAIAARKGCSEEVQRIGAHLRQDSALAECRGDAWGALR